MSVRRILVRGCLYLILTLIVLAVLALGLVIYQGHRTPKGNPVYVALGSSYAAGAGPGPLQQDSPLLCARSVAGYPQQLARKLGLPIVDMTCGGAVTSHLLSGGQFFQGPQIRTIDARTRLVTITVGGNDVGLVGDLSMLALRRQNTFTGWLARRMWGGPKSMSQRDYGRLRSELLDVIRHVRTQAPGATIVVATYPAILPPQGTCARLQLSSAEVDLMRPVEQSLAAATRSAAAQGGAIVIDMHALGTAHHACSTVPWTRGWAAFTAAPFHPTLDGVKATADAIAQVLPQSIAARR
jgi:lysophospholipase L1-like esterase